MLRSKATHSCGTVGDLHPIPFLIGRRTTIHAVIFNHAAKIHIIIENTHKTQKKSLHCNDFLFFCGPGGNRTHVRTRKPCAFYMLIPDFIFVIHQDLDHQVHPYPLKLHHDIGACRDYFRFYCAAGSSDSEQHPWSDVSFPHLVKKLSSRSTVLRSSSESILVVAN